MLSDVTILSQREDYDYPVGGAPVKGTKTTFTVGSDGPFSVFLSDAAFNAAANVALIEKKADAVRGVRELHQEKAR